MGMFEKFRARRKRKRKQQRRSRLARDLQFFRENDNPGLLFKRLSSMPGIADARLETGWTCFVDVTMKDGFEISTSSSISTIALRKAVRAVAARLYPDRTKEVSQMARCQERPHFRYTWPGKDESFVCFEHSRRLQRVAAAMGLHLQLIPLSEDEQAQASCSQNLNAD